MSTSTACPRWRLGTVGTVAYLDVPSGLWLLVHGTGEVFLGLGILGFRVALALAVSPSFWIFSCGAAVAWRTAE